MDIFRNRAIFLQVILIALVLAMMTVPAESFPSQDADYSGQGLEIDLHNILINEANGILEVQEIIRVVNGGDQPIVVDKTLPEEEQYTFQVVLPPSTISLSFPENIELDNDIISTATGFAYTIPLKPGINELEFFYKIEPNNEGQFLLDRKIVYPTQSVYFIIQGEVGLSGAKMVYYGNMDIGQVYYWDDPIPGEEVAVIAGKGIKPDNSGSGSGSG
ncbi:MAG: hypothetical protein KGZ96_01620, partial [Clostridia bacterium]|nr:hypothetical protein [Clostridia bacterium]